MDSIKHLFRQVSGSDYLLIILVSAGVYFLVGKMENRNRIQLTVVMALIIFCFRLIVGFSFTDLVVQFINNIHFIYIWGPLSLTIFITSMMYEKGNMSTIITRALIVSICICVSLYFIFR